MQHAWRGKEDHRTVCGRKLSVVVVQQEHGSQRAITTTRGLHTPPLTCQTPLFWQSQTCCAAPLWRSPAAWPRPS